MTDEERKRKMLALMIVDIVRLIDRFPEASNDDIVAAVFKFRAFPIVPANPNKSVTEGLKEMVVKVRRGMMQQEAAP